MTAPPRAKPLQAWLTGAPAILTCLGVLLLYCVPASLLDALGLSYGQASGSAIEKIHPGTDCVVLAFVLAALQTNDPARYLTRQARRFPGATAFLVCVVLVTIYLIRVVRAPFTPVIDTFVMPILLLPLLVDLPPGPKRIIACGFHVFMALNAVVGIIEFITDWRLFPLNLNGLDVTPDMEPRASGILGHPLASAAGAGMYLIILSLRFDAGLPRPLRWPAIALQAVSLGAFGGRTSLVMSYAFLAVVMLVEAGRIVGGRRFDRRRLGLGLLALPLVIAAAALLMQSGFFDVILLRFSDDNGSAHARAAMLDLFSYLSWQEILLGPDGDHMQTVLHLEGLEVGIESFWLGYILVCGLAMSLFFFAGFALFLIEIMRRVDPWAWVILAFFLVVISTTNSLATKSVSLGQFVAMVFILMPPRARVAAASRIVPGGMPLAA